MPSLRLKPFSGEVKRKRVREKKVKNLLTLREAKP